VDFDVCNEPQEIENGWLSGCSGGRAGGDTTPSHRRPSEAGSSCEMPPPPPEQEEHSLAKSHKERLQSHTTPRPESTEPTQHQDDRKQEHVAVDTDSAFDDDASLISGSSGSSEESKRTKVEDTAAQKAEKIKVALKKIHEASIQKVFLKVFCEDGSTKSLVADERMTVYYVLNILIEKCHVKPSVDWALVETLPDLYMERHLEEDELIVENLLNWKVGSENRILFERRPARHDLFRQPELYLLQPSTTILPHTRKTLLEDFFSPSNGSVPNIEGPLWLKSEGKKNWKKHFFVLKSSGLYYIPKGKKSSSNLVCFSSFDVNQAYTGVGWKKKFKSPTDFCLAIKHPRIQEKSPKYIWYLCAETEQSLNRWLTGIRIVKRKAKMLENFKVLQEDTRNRSGQKKASEANHSVENAGSDSSETSLNNDIIYSPASESRSFDSGVSSIMEACSDAACSSGEAEVSVSMSRSDSFLSKASNGSDTSDSAFETDSPAGGTIKRNPKLAVAATMEPVEEIRTDVAGSTNFHRASFEQISSTIRRKCTEMTKLEPAAACLNLDAPNKEEMNAKSIHHHHHHHPPLEVVEDQSLPPPPPEAYECFTGRRASSTSVQSLPPPPPVDLSNGPGGGNSKFDEWKAETRSESSGGGQTRATNILPPRQESDHQEEQVCDGWLQGGTPALTQQSLLTTSALGGLYADQRPLYGQVKTPQTATHTSIPHKSYSNLQSEFIYPEMRVHPAHQDNGTAHHQMELLSRIPNEAPLRPSFAEGGAQLHNPLACSQQENNTNKTLKKKSSLKQTTSQTPRTVKQTKKISFDDEVRSMEHSLPCPSSHADQGNLPIIEPSIRRPNPGKLFSPQSAAATPPREFLADLQRVMSTKLNLSEKCPSEFSKPAQDYNERDVSNWILQSLKHYRAGSGGDMEQQSRAPHTSTAPPPFSSHHPTTLTSTYGVYQGSDGPLNTSQPYSPYATTRPPNCQNIIYPQGQPVPPAENVTQWTAGSIAGTFQNQNLIYESRSVPPGAQPIPRLSGPQLSTLQTQNPISPQSRPHNTNYVRLPTIPLSYQPPPPTHHPPPPSHHPPPTSNHPPPPSHHPPPPSHHPPPPSHHPPPPNIYQASPPLHAALNNQGRYCLQRSQSANTHRQLFQEKYPQRFYDDQTMRSSSPIYGTGLDGKRVPPPPPKRSETTQLSHTSRL